MSGWGNNSNDVPVPCVNWGHIYIITRPPVCGTLHGMLVPPEDVDDYFENVIVRMMKNEQKKHVLCTYDDEHVKGHACWVARYIVLEEQGKYANRQRLMQENPEAWEPLTGQDKPYIFHLFVVELENAIAKGLSPRERAIITMTKEGRTLDEMAIALGLSKATVRNILQEVKQKLEGVL